MRNRIVICCFVGHYLPGYRSGGPVRSISNFVDHFGKDLDIRIVTSDRDVSDKKPYINVRVDAWNTVGNAQVFYASSATLNLRGIICLLRSIGHDVLYLNSFFSFKFTLLPLALRFIGLAPKTSCVIAPRGEFSENALALKSWKKWTYIQSVKFLGLYKDLVWQASSTYEKNDIRRKLGSQALRILIAPDLSSKKPFSSSGDVDRYPKGGKPLRLVFLSRISPMKNLDFLLRVLRKITAPLELAIYGPVDDVDYWKDCQALLITLPRNISAKYLGEVPHEAVSSVFKSSDLFVFPTRGENFGHVILESLSVGTPVLVSDLTPWASDQRGGLVTIPLDETQWCYAIESWVVSSHEVLLARRKAAISIAKSNINDPITIQQNRFLFMHFFEVGV